nr:hypothetical protein [uncultured Pseudomonas sp.]
MKQPFAAPATLLDLGQELWLKTARLKGRLAPETALSLSATSNVMEVGWQEFQGCMKELEFAPGIIHPGADRRHRIVEALENYSRSLLACSEPNSCSALLTITRHKLDELGLRTNLWSLDRAAKRAGLEYEQLAREDHPIARQIQFLQIFLRVCIEEVDRILEAFFPSLLRARVYEAFKTNKRILDAKMNSGIAPALLCLLVQGSMPLKEFEMFTGLSSESAGIEVAKLEKLGILRCSPCRSGWVIPWLPHWFVACILPM